jgi:hypothetical protein
MERKRRILDPSNEADAALIASAPKAGAEYYDSDEDVDPGPNDLFRDVHWGALANDFSDNEAFPSEPSFRYFVPGRFERLEDGSASDQKHKLIVRLTNTNGRKVIYCNLPPRDWNNQKAISGLNQSVSGLYRRNTDAKLCTRVPYTEAERDWILTNLTNGKPPHGWKQFAEDYNNQFAGKVILGDDNSRPRRSTPGLKQAVSRWGERSHAKGVMPIAQKPSRKGVAKVAK